MNKAVLFTLIIPSISLASPYSDKVCKSGQVPENVVCEKLSTKKIANTWEEIFPNKNELALVQRLNRSNTTLWKGRFIILPKDKSDLDVMHYSPFPLVLSPPIAEHFSKENLVVVDLDNLAWGAYDEKGTLARWSVANGGRGLCPETGKYECYTPTGTFKVVRKGNYWTRSKLYPVECANKKKCGFRMFYYMGFGPKGEGIHGAKNLPGFNASHGCVRSFTADVKWLNTSFLKVGSVIKVVGKPFRRKTSARIIETENEESKDKNN